MQTLLQLKQCCDEKQIWKVPIKMMHILQQKQKKKKKLEHDVIGGGGVAALGRGGWGEGQHFFILLFYIPSIILTMLNFPTKDPEDVRRVCKCVLCTRARKKAKKVKGSCYCDECRKISPFKRDCSRRLMTESVSGCSDFWSLACAGSLRSRRPQM